MRGCASRSSGLIGAGLQLQRLGPHARHRVVPNDRGVDATAGAAATREAAGGRGPCHVDKDRVAAPRDVALEDERDRGVERGELRIPLRVLQRRREQDHAGDVDARTRRGDGADGGQKPGVQPKCDGRWE